MENLFLAWREFSRGKKNKKDVQKFEFNLEDNLFVLHESLKNKTYQHAKYTAFSICDPKLRKIHKATVKDRVLHHATFRILYLIFDKNFIFDSYSCRIGKGTHRAILRLEKFARKVSKNNHSNIFALKCDIKKFFDSVDQDILLEIIKNKIDNSDALLLLEIIIKSFKKENNKGLPLGNVTSQLFANIYMNELDQFMKHKLKTKYYLRYSDDFIILNEDVDYLKGLVLEIEKFLDEKLDLKLHEDKIITTTYRQGVDFLGYIVKPHYRILRTKTKKRIIRKIKDKHIVFKKGVISQDSFECSLQSYLGILKHCSGFNIKKEIEKMIES